MTSRHRDSDELQLLAEIAAGNAEAFAELYDRNGPALYKRLLAGGATAVAAECTLHRTFLALWILAPRLSASTPASEHLTQLLRQHRNQADAA